ncbi:MAG: glycoside hydrolase family 16 protein, partial [Bradyrhizobium sp.]
VVWADEFNGTSVDRTKWDFQIDGNGGGNGEMQYYTDRPENIKVAGGNLVITGVKEKNKYKGKEYTSGKLMSKGKGDWLYGRFEARIKIPIGGKGTWPAFWMMPTDAKYGGWARSGEIDIMENVGHQPGTLYGTLHYHDGWPKNKHTGGKLELPGGRLGDAFHVYAVEWEPGVMRWYFDGKLYVTQTKWDTVGHPFPAPFDQRFFYILNFAIGGAWPGKPAPDTKFPQQMLVDYVRVYQPPGGFPKTAVTAAPEAAAPAPAPAEPPAAPAPAPEPAAPAAQETSTGGVPQPVAPPPAAPKAAQGKNKAGPWYAAGEFQQTNDSQDADGGAAQAAGVDADSTPTPAPTMDPAGSAW